MNRTTVRRTFKAMAVPGLVLLALLLWDYFGNYSDWLVPLVVLAVTYLAILLLLLLLPVDHDGMVRIDEPEAEPMSYHFPPEAHP